MCAFEGKESEGERASADTRGWSEDENSRTHGLGMKGRLGRGANHTQAPGDQPHPPNPISTSE